MDSSSENFPRSYLAHHTGKHAVSGRRVEDFQTQPITIARPVSGIATGTITCTTCGRALTIRVASEAIVRRWQRRWLAAGLIMVVPALVMLWLGFQSAFDRTEAGDGPPAFLWYSIGLGFSGVLAYVLVNRRGNEDGVRGPDAPIFRWVRTGTHRILHSNQIHVPDEVLRHLRDHGELPDEGWEDHGRHLN